MPLSYPENLPSRVEALERLVEQLYTASQTRAPMDTIRTSDLTIGDPDGPHIKLIPNGDNGAELWFVPSGGSNPTRIIGESDGSEAILRLISGSVGGDQSELVLNSGEVSMTSAGGFAYWGGDEARFGYDDGSNPNYFRFGAAICRHFGQWDDFASLPSNAGLLWGSVTAGGSFTGATVFYPSNMDSNMGPIVGLRNGAGVSMAWCITASSTSSFDVKWETAGSVAFYMCSFRH